MSLAEARRGMIRRVSPPGYPLQRGPEGGLPPLGRRGHRGAARWRASPLQVTTAQTDETTAGANTVDQFGDYNGMAAFLTRFLPVWTDRRSNGVEEIWTAPVSDP